MHVTVLVSACLFVSARLVPSFSLVIPWPSLCMKSQEGIGTSTPFSAVGRHLPKHQLSVSWVSCFLEFP